MPLQVGKRTVHFLVSDPTPPVSDGAGCGSAQYTADFTDVPGPGNLRADYVLPSRGLRVRGGSVFWPVSSDPLSRLTGTFPFPTSDHRLVWLDIA